MTKKNVVGKVKYERGFNYKVDKEGNVLKEKYNLLKDPYTLVTLAIIILGGMYYLQMDNVKTNEANFEEACITYIELRNIWMLENPGQIPTLEQVLSTKESNYNIKEDRIYR